LITRPLSSASFSEADGLLPADVVEKVGLEVVAAG
jgi:hypothetical protein